jgi:hypothetical protein
MYIDAQQLFSDAQALAGTAVSTNVINLGSLRFFATGEPVGVMFSVDVAADVADADETYQFDIQTDDNAGFATPVVLARLAFGVAGFPAASKLAAGYKFAISLPKCDLLESYLRVNYTLGGTTPSVTVTAHLVPLSMVPMEHTYADAIVIS